MILRSKVAIERMGRSCNITRSLLPGVWVALMLCGCSVQPPARSVPVPAPTREALDPLLDDWARRCFTFFIEQADPRNGLVPDSATTAGKPSEVASVAATGFGLTALCIGAERGWISRDEAAQRIESSLRFLCDEMPNEHGFYYHFVDPETGARAWNSELSSIDTALLLAGVVTAGTYFKDTPIESLGQTLLDRVDWPWMLAGGSTFSMGWSPEGGFLGARWSYYCELMILYILADASRTYPPPEHTWHAWRREPVGTYAGMTFMQCPPLFTHQYAHAWIDFRNRRDAYADYWLISKLATLAQRRFCADLSGTFPAYSTNLWGLTASAGPKGYAVWGGPPPAPQTPIDGTVVPCAPGGSIPFAPEECRTALHTMYRRYKHSIWGRYGFADAFNPQTGWVADKVIGIDVGITLLMIENQRDGFTWHYFMRNPDIQSALRKAGFISTAPITNSADTV